MALKRAAICKGCWERLRLPVPLRGPLSVPFRAFGVRPSRMNPNLCTICELNFTTVMRARKVTIDATILFADLRGYTGLSQSLSPDAMSGLLDAFYDECASAIWEQDGLLNKTIGDAVMAVFNFPVSHGDHVQRALQAARDIQERCRDRKALLKGTFGLTGAELGVGIGIHTGEVRFLHEPDGGKVEEGERLAIEAFPILGQPSAAAEPSQRAFADPALGQHDEGLGLIRPLNDLDLYARANSFHCRLEFRPLIASVGKEPAQEGEGAEQGRHQRRAAVAVLDVGGVDDRVHQQALRVDENVTLLAVDLLTRVVARWVDAGPPFSALLTLWLSMIAAVGLASRAAASRHFT